MKSKHKPLIKQPHTKFGFSTIHSFDLDKAGIDQARVWLNSLQAIVGRKLPLKRLTRKGAKLNENDHKAARWRYQPPQRGKLALMPIETDDIELHVDSFRQPMQKRRHRQRVDWPERDAAVELEAAAEVVRLDAHHGT